MLVVTLLALIIGLPILVVGCVQFLVFKFGGWRLLLAFSALVALACYALLISASGMPAIYGNKSAPIAQADLALALLLIENLAILCLPLIRRCLAWTKAAEARQVSQLDKNSGMNS